MNIMDAIKDEVKTTTLSRTENGALGFASCKSDLVDFFYKVSSMRKATRGEKQAAFLKAAAEDRDLAFRVLFFARDIRGGLGERSLFRDIVIGLPDEEVKPLLPLLPEYGRWDDVLALLDDGISVDLMNAIVDLVHKQFDKDLEDAKAGKSISLLAKWLPSIRKVSKKKVETAKFLCRKFGLQERDYRHALSALRKHLKVVEKAMSANEWKAIDFQAVPSKAAKNYRGAFMKHDEERYREYLGKLSKGEAKVNAGAVFPYEIVTAYREGTYGRLKQFDQLLESQWKALPLPKGLLENAIVVRDGSGSMTTGICNTKSTALDVATSLAVLMSEHLKGPFANRFITFSERPKFIDLGGCTNLHQKLQTTFSQDECSNTDIERTMDLILNAAVKNHLKQEEIPAVVIVSDMEFDEARGEYSWNWKESDHEKSQKTLFKIIAERWEGMGYKLPKMVFWNVANRTGTVPMQENGSGLLLVSGFSQNILDMLSGEGDMLEVIRKKVETERYDPVIKALKGV